MGSCVQLYSLAETPQPPPPAFGLIYEGAIGQPRETTYLCNPVGEDEIIRYIELSEIELRLGLAESFSESRKVIYSKTIVMESMKLRKIETAALV